MRLRDWLAGRTDRSPLSLRGSRRRSREIRAEVLGLEARTLLSGLGLGVESRINVGSAGIQQMTTQGDGSLAVDGQGNVVAVWSSSNPQGRGWNIVGRRTDAQGNPLGGEFVVNTTVRAANLNPVVSVAEDGSFVVAWDALGNPADRHGWGAFTRVFSADGTPRSGEILVSSSIAGPQRDLSVAGLNSGLFVVSWSGSGQGVHQSVFGRVFDASGDPVSGVVRLSDYVRGGQHDVSVVALPDGGFQAVWSGRGAGDWSGIYSRRFDAFGNAEGGSFRVDTASWWAWEGEPVLAVAGNELVFAWQSHGDWLDRSGFGVLARRFTREGAPLGPAFRVNQTIVGNQQDPSITSVAGGGFAVAWEGRGAGDGQGIFLREFDADGTPKGDERLVNQTVAGLQADPALVASGQGYAVAWNGRTEAGASGDARGVALRGAVATEWLMPSASVGSRDDVMTFTIPNIGVVQQVSPKTITITNTTDRTVFPILESANNNVVQSNDNGHKGLGLYDPYDAPNLEYRAYVGYRGNDGKYYLGLRPGETVTIPVPLVFWDAGRILIASDGANLIPAVDNVAPPIGQPNSPNPFHYHDFQNFMITQGVLDALVSQDKVPQTVADGLKPLLGQTYTVIGDFQAAVAQAIGGAAAGQYQVPILNRAGAVIPTKRFRDDLADGVHGILWYRGQSVGGMAEGPAGSAPAQLLEMTFRSDIFANPKYLTHKDIDPNGNSGEVHNLVNYDVSYVDSMTLPVSMQALNVPLDPSGNMTTATGTFGWVGANDQVKQLQDPLKAFTSPNPDANTNLNGLGNYFGKYGYPKYYIPAEVEAITGIKVPAGQNLALDSPITNGRSAWDQNRFILTSSGSGPISYGAPGAINSVGKTIYFAQNYLAELTAVNQAFQAGDTVLVQASLNNYIAGTQVTGVDLTPDNLGRLSVTVNNDDVNPGGTNGGVYTFVRPVVDYVMTTLANLWFSWADHYYELVKGITPDASYAGSIAKDTNALELTTPVPAGSLVVGMPVSGPGMPAGFEATIIGFEYTDETKTQIQTVELSKLSTDGGSGTNYVIGTVQRIQPQNTVGFPVVPYALGFTNPADPDYDLRFARSVYTVMDSMNTIPVAGPTSPAIIDLMANVLGGNIGFIPNIGVSKSGDGGVRLVADVIRDALKSVLRGVDDFQVDTEDMGHWYPDPSLTGKTTGQTTNGKPAEFNVYNLNPFVWFVHKKLGLSGYGFSLDDDAADVGADGASTLRVVVGSGDALPDNQFYKAEWTHAAPYGPVKTEAGTISVVQGGDYDGKYQITGLDLSPLPVVLQVQGVGSSGEPGALVSGPGIAPGTRVYFTNIGGNGVILDTPATIPTNPTGPYYFTGTPPKVAIPAQATAIAGQNAWTLNVLGADGFYGESSLSYTWSLRSGPSGGSASFSANGTNASKSTVATVTDVPGTYVFQVTISEPADVGGFSRTSEVSIVVPPSNTRSQGRTGIPAWRGREAGSRFRFT